MSKVNSLIDALAKDFPHFVVKEDRFDKYVCIGKGGFSVIYKAEDKITGQIVAIKEMIGKGSGSDPAEVLFSKEIRHLILLLDSPFVIKLVGFTISKPYKICLEMCEGGILEKYILPPNEYIIEEEEDDDEEEEDEEEDEENGETKIKKREKNPIVLLDPTERTFVAYCCAVGMKSLSDNKIIHNDFKSINVLLKNNEPRIIDFGAAKFESENGVNSQLTVFWSAPECLDSICSLKSDVYSYGLLLWEMFYQKRPWKDVRSLYEITKNIQSGKRPNIDDNDIQLPLIQLIKQCWDNDQNVRPTFECIVEKFINDEVSFPGTDSELFHKKVITALSH